MSKLDPKLELLLKEKELKNQTRRTARALMEDEETPQELQIILKFTGDISELQALGFRPGSVARTIATGRVNIDDLPAIMAHDNVIAIEMSRLFRPLLDKSVASIKADMLHNAATPFTGLGVILGIVDSGIDFTHKCFRKADGTSRILYLWDHMPPNNVQGTPPAGFNYGIEYDKAAIDAALSQNRPLQALRHEDTLGHGSHVAGIAGGNGSAIGNCRLANTFVGVAPETHLIVVKVDTRLSNLGNSSFFLDALSYVFEKAASLDYPAVVNLSIGSHIGAHDGTSLVEQFIDELLETPGRAIVSAAGNAADKKLHAQGYLSDTNQWKAELEFRIPFLHRNTCILDVWYNHDDRFEVSISPPGNAISSVVVPSQTSTLTLENGNTAKISSRLSNAQYPDNNIYIELDRDSRHYVEAGVWTLYLSGTVVNDGTFHCWLDEEGAKHAAQFLNSSAAEGYITGIPATAHKTITVGAYSDRIPFVNGKLTDFSARGPTRDERLKPEIVAPGLFIQSVRSALMEDDFSCSLFCCSNYKTQNGTSMAAPHVAGVVALMLQKNPGLSISDIRTHLFDHTQTTDEMGLLPNNLWGHGIVDAQAAVEAVPAVGSVPGPTSVPQSQPLSSPSASPAPSLGTAAPIDLNLLAHIESEILQTATGQHYAYLVQKHFEEVQRLVNTNRRVGAVWVREGGPTIVRRLLQAFYNPDEPLPHTVGGKSLVESLNRFVAILRRYGSPTLQADLEQYRDVLLNFEGLSYNQFLSHLR